jgi:hypothetical protein
MLSFLNILIPPRYLITSKLLKNLLLILVIVWVAYFYYIKSFGFYEDDYAVITTALDLDIKMLLDNFVKFFTRWPQGRPLGYFLPSLFTFIGYHLGKLHGVYAIGGIIIIINSLLFYKILESLNLRSKFFILTGTLVFTLFPADTTKILLTHSLILQPSLTFLLVATLLYLKEKRWLPYLVIIASLVTYESAFFTFLGVPFITGISFNKNRIKEYIRHTAILIALTLIVIVMRKLFGEVKVVSLTNNPIPVIINIVKSVFIGPKTIIILFFRAPLVTFIQGNVLPVFLVTSGFFTLLFYQAKLELTSKTKRLFCLSTRLLKTKLSLNVDKNVWKAVNLLVSGIILLCCSYITAFSHFPPTAYFGRMTSVHLCASFGASLIFASITYIVASFANVHKKLYLLTLGLGLYMGSLLSYQFMIQQDFVRGWQQQKTFWSNVIELIPDATENTLIFVDKKTLTKTKYIETNSWADPIILEQMFSFPKEWKAPPRVFLIDSEKLAESLKFESDKIFWEVPTATWWSYWQEVPQGNVIFIDSNMGKLVRKEGNLNLNKDLIIELKEGADTFNNNWDYGVLFNYFLL